MAVFIGSHSAYSFNTTTRRNVHVDPEENIKNAVAEDKG